MVCSDVPIGIGADELPDELPRLLVDGRAQPRLVTGAPMHARREGKEPFDRLHDRAERRRTRSVVEVHIRDPATVEDRNRYVHSHQRTTQPQRLVRPNRHDLDGTTSRPTPHR